MKKFILYFIVLLLPGIHDAMAQVPFTPVVKQPGYISSTGFEINWGLSADVQPAVDSYLIDVATDGSFTNYLPFLHDYQLYTFGGELGFTVADLSPGTTYAWRIRASNSSGISGNSAVQFVTTKPLPSLTSPGDWKQTYATAFDDNITSITSDESGTVYMTGVFGNSLTMGPSVLNSHGDLDIFLASMNSAGVLSEPVNLGGTGEDFSGIIKVYNGFAYTAFLLASSADVDPGVGVSNAGPGLVVAKYSVDGVFSGATTLAGLEMSSFAVGPAGVVMVGSFADIVDFDPGAGINQRIPNGDNDGYIASYSLDGAFQWVGVITGSGYEDVNDVIVDGSDVYVGGSTDYDQDADIDPTAGVSISGPNSNFILKINGATGGLVWLEDYHSEVGSNLSRNVVLADLGATVLAGGSFSGNIDFGTGSPAYSGHAGQSNASSGYLAAFDKTSGATTNVHIIPTSADGYVFIESMQMFGEHFYLNGNFYGSVDFNFGRGGGERNVKELDGFTGTRFIASYTLETGEVDWVKTYRLHAENGPMHANADGLYFAGGFDATFDLNPYSGSMIVSGSNDMFLVKYNITSPPAPPSAPVASAATGITGTGFTASWGAVAGASYYRVDVSADNFVTYFETAQNLFYDGVIVQGATTFAVTELDPLTDYKYRVRAITADGASAYSNEVAVSTIALGPPPPNNFVAQFISNTGFVVHFDAMPGATGYELEISSDNFATVMSNYNASIPASSYPYWNLVGLEPSTEYQARVRTVDATGTSPNSPTVVVTTLANPAQVSSNLWVQNFGSTSEEFVTSIASDPVGNVYVTGKTSELAMTIGGFTLNPIGLADIFIAKFNSAGVAQWAKRVGGTAADEGWHIAADGTGVYVSGVFGGTADFDPNGGVTNLVGNGSVPYPNLSYLDDGFIAKYNLGDGSLVWAQSLGNAWPNVQSGKALYADGIALFITGTYMGVNDFDPNGGTYNLTSAGVNDMFVAGYDRWTGAINWAQSLGGTLGDIGVSITGDLNNLYVAGKHIGAMDLNPGAATQNVTGQGSFISSFGKNGAFLWAKAYQSTDEGNGEYLSIYDLALDNTSIYAVGSFFGVADFDPNAGTHELTAYSNSMFGTKLTKQGDHVWAGQTGGYDGGQPMRVIADASGIYVVGISYWTTDFDPGPGEANRGSRAGDIFISRYNGADGGFEWAKTIGSWDYEFPRSAAALTNDGLYVGGAFFNTVNFDPYTGLVNKTSNGGTDGFIAKYESTSPAPPPPPVQLPAAFVSSHGVNMEWQSVSDIIEYRADVSTDDFVTFWAVDLPCIGGNPVKNQAIWLYMQPSTTYKMRITAVAPGGIRSGYSNVVDFTTAAHPVQASPNLWTSTFGNANADEVSGIATDASGNVYTTGFYYAADITIGSTALTNAGAGDVFFAKYSPSGTVLWAKSLSSTHDERGVSIAVDATGVYILGYFYGTSNLDFDPDGGVQLISPEGISFAQTFLAKYSLADGSFIWAKPLNDTWNPTGKPITADGTGVYITGAFFGTNDFDPGAGTVTRTAPDSDDVYLARYSATDGSLVWVTNFGSPENDLGYSVLLDGSYVYTSGYLIGTGDIDPGANTNSISGAYFSKFNSADGSVVWTKNSPGAQYAFDLSKNASDLYVAGSFVGTVDMDPGAGSQYLYGYGAATTGYVGRYTLTDGDFISAHVIRASDAVYPRRIIADNSGYYIGGNATWAVDFDPSTGEDNRHAYFADAILARYTTEGDLVWAKTLGYTGDDLIRGGLAVGTDGLYAAGHFSGTVNFDPYNNFTNASSNGFYDGFIAKYQIEVAPPGAPTANAATNITSSGFMANWAEQATAANYRLDVSTSDIFADFLPGFQNLTVGQLSKGLTGLDPGTTYYYQVRAVNDAGASANSNMITVTTAAATLTAPVANAATAITATAFMTSWNTVASATEYQLDVSADDFVGYVAGYQNRSVTSTSEGVVGLQAEISYKYRVRAVGAGGTSANSNVVQVTTAVNPPFAPVAIAPTSFTTTSFTANWNASATATDYKLDVSADNFVTFVAGYNAKSVAGTSDAISGLTAGTAYQYRVRAANAGGTSFNSNIVLATTLPPPPPAPVATAGSGVTAYRFGANWNAVNGATSYRLDVSIDNFATNIAGYDDKTVSDGYDAVIALTPSTAYKYRVRAVNANGTSVNSNVIDVTTLALPDAPVATAATSVTATGFTANWNSVSGATSYRLDVSTDNFTTFIAGFNDQTVAGNSDAVSGLTPSTAYKYRVRAVDANGTSLNSNVIDVATPALPNAPAATAATSIAATGFTANWNVVAGATSYRLDVSGNNFSTYVAGYNDKTVSSNSDAVTGLAIGTAYKYRVRAVNANGTSVQSNVIDVTTLALPAAPAAIAASAVTATTFTANWNSVSDATSYRLDVSADNFSTYLTGFNDRTVANLSESVASLLPSTSYQYRVRAVNANGTSVNSNVITLTTSALPAPSAFSASGVNATGFTASWSTVTGATSYLLYVSADNFTTFVSGFNGVTVAGTTAAVTGLTASTNYSYKVRATSSSSTSVDSNVVPVTTTIPPPSSPTATAATSVTAASFNANWNAVSGATSYELDVSTDSFSSFVSGYQGKSVTATSESVPAGSSTTYQYRVRAVNVGGSSANSNTISLTTPPPPPDAPVANSATAITTTGFTANWSTVAGATGYRLDVSADNFATMLVDYDNMQASGTNAGVTGLSAATPYKYRVRAENATGASSNSNEVDVTTQPKQSQTITFAQPAPVTMGGPEFTLSPTSSSGLDVTLTPTTDHTTIVGNSATLVRAGKATITASQAGDDNFNAATPVARQFCINPVKPTVTMTGALTEPPELSSNALSGNQWFKEGVAISGATDQTYSVAAAGIYTVKVTVETCASEMSADFEVIVTGDISSSNNVGLTIAPNPAEDKLLIRLPGTGRKDVVIFHVNGAITESFITERSEEEISVKSYAQGVYLVKVRTSEGNLVGKFVKK